MFIQSLPSTRIAEDPCTFFALRYNVKMDLAPGPEDLMLDK